MSVARTIGLILLGGLVACERGKPAGSAGAGRAAGARPVDTSRSQGASTVTAVAPPWVRDACGNVDSIIGELLGQTTQGSNGVGKAPSARVVRGDTTFAYWDRPTRAPACHVTVTSDSGKPTGLFEDLTRRLESRGGWESLATTYSADGPDGSIISFRRNSVMCLVTGSWDGGDDADSSYVPAPGYGVDVTCAPAPLAPSTTTDTSKPQERSRR